MQLRTKIAVTHLDIDNLLTGGSVDGIVNMVIGSRNLVLNQNQDGTLNASVEVMYALIDEQGRQLPTSDGGKFTAKDTLDNPNYVSDLSNSISTDVTAGTNLIDVYDSNVLEMAKIKFADNYGITTSDIEVI